MKKFFAALFASVMLLGLFSVAASAQHGDGPGPNGNNDKGLCTAYFNGQKKGHDKNGDPPPFQGLEDHADEPDGEDGANSGDEYEEAADVYEYCQGMIGGNPDNGRYDCSGNETDGYTCEENDAPGNSGNGNGNGGG